MSIAFESNTSNRIERSGFVHGMLFKSIYDSPDSGGFAGDRRFNAKEIVQERADELDTCSSSSIGRDSDSAGGLSDGEGDSGECEVQSSFKGPLDSLDSLEEVLPIKRGISTFYSGKSKSLTSLADVSSCYSVKDIAKPEDAYTRKRKNLLAHNNFWDKNRNFNSKGNGGGISKRLANSSRSSLALAVMMSSSESNNNSDGSNSNSSSPSLCLPPLPPNGRRSRSPNNELSASPPTPRQNFSPWRSFSLSDLQNAAAATPSITALVSENRRKADDLH